MTRSYLAFDIGAESGRAMLGRVEAGRLSLREIHRFPNSPSHIGDTLRWDLDSLLSNIREGIERAGPIDSLGIDTWGVDFVLLDSAGDPIELPYHYRDSRTDGVMEQAFSVVPRDQIYENTGIQFMPFNTLYQLYSMVLSGSPALKKAHRFLTIPDYLNYKLGGEEAVCEFTNATTTQCYDPTKGTWATEILEALGIPPRIFPQIVQPGAVLGAVNGARLIAPACHDTGSAVAGVPAEGQDFAWLSSGTWSILGTENPSPIINDSSYAANFTNEGGVAGTFRFCKNVMGLWIVQQCRSTWESEGRLYSYADLTAMAERAQPDYAVLDPDDPEFLKPGDMPARVRDWLRRHGQPVPGTPGQLVRVVLESLALKYKLVLDRLEELSGRRLERIHVIGGGSQNVFLNQLTADACHRTVVAGPVEATAIGNIAVQMIALGEVGSLADARDVIRQSFSGAVFEPAIP